MNPLGWFACIANDRNNCPIFSDISKDEAGDILTFLSGKKLGFRWRTGQTINNMASPDQCLSSGKTDEASSTVAVHSA